MASHVRYQDEGMAFNVKLRNQEISVYIPILGEAIRNV